ncbi:MAG TPA: hypothetical protein VK427_14785 [Kofleriaceae bacterium]|nr:hypothetical protein [Kofleriaceae bacterium]
MGETFCCMICRLLQARSAACIECGAPTMISLESGADALKYGNLSLQHSPTTRKEKIANAAGVIGIAAGYAGLVAGAALWWPAVPIILGAGAGGLGITAWRARDVTIAPVELLPAVTATDAVTRRGIARRLRGSGATLVEQHVIKRASGDVLLRHTRITPFLLVDVAGERVIIDGTVRITSGARTRALGRRDIVLEALGIPPNVPVHGVIETAVIREGDRVRVTGALAVEILPALAFHRDAGEANVMRGGPGRVVAIACEEGAAS